MSSTVAARVALVATKSSRRRSLVLIGVCVTLALGGCDQDVMPGVQRCALDRALIDASHVVRFNVSTGTVEAVTLARPSDPRADVFERFPLTSGARLDFRRVDGFDGFDDTGSDAVALVGQPRTDLPEQWAVSAVAKATDGTLAFVGRCAVEYDRQFAAMKVAFAGSGTVEFVERMVDEALLPGRGADLANIAAAPGSGASEVSDPLAPRWDGRVRVVAVTVSFAPRGLAGSAGLQSEVGYFGIGVGEGLAVTALDTLAVLPLEGPVSAMIVDEVGGVVGVPLDLTDSRCRDASAVYLSVNLEDLSVACQPVARTDTQPLVDEAQRNLQFDDSVAIPDYADGPPSVE